LRNDRRVKIPLVFTRRIYTYIYASNYSMYIHTHRHSSRFACVFICPQNLAVANRYDDKHLMSNEVTDKTQSPLKAMYNVQSPSRNTDCPSSSKPAMANRLLDWFSVVMADFKHRRQHSKFKGGRIATCRHFRRAKISRPLRCPGNPPKSIPDKFSGFISSGSSVMMSLLIMDLYPIDLTSFVPFAKDFCPTLSGFIDIVMSDIILTLFRVPLTSFLFWWNFELNFYASPINPRVSRAGTRWSTWSTIVNI